jgi:ribonucleotide reductase beta subunit family protein with ferritin-like domain
MESNQEELQYTDDKPVHIVAAQGDTNLAKVKPKDHKDEETITISIADLNSSEPMLQPDINRFTLFPIKRHDLWKAYKDHEKAAWTAEELDYSADKIEWEQLSKDEKYFIEHVLAFFNSSDLIVMKNIGENFASEIQWPEALAFYAFQNYIEQIHSQVYSTLIDTYVEDPKRKDELFRAIETIPCVKRKAEWAMKWMDSEKATFAERLVAFAVVEGVFFSGSFCAIFWLKSRGIMVSGLGKSNELIARDEGLHCSFAILLYNYLNNKLTKERIWEIFKEAVDIESQFITESIPCKLIGMNSSLMIRYIKHVSNFWMHQLTSSSGRKCPKLYSVKNPFPFMDMLSTDGKTNFFEQRTTEYSRMINSKEQTAETFINLDDNF